MDITESFEKKIGYFDLTDHLPSSGRITNMAIREVIQQVLSSGYLSLEMENQLQHLFETTDYDLQDLNAFMSLQLAAMAGRIRKQSPDVPDMA